MNKREYMLEFKEFHQVYVLLMKEWSEIIKNIYLQSGKSGLSQDLINKMEIYEINLKKTLLMFEQMNPPVEFKTAHELYLQNIHYYLQSLECVVELQVAVAEKDENKVNEFSNKLDTITNLREMTGNRGYVEFKKAAGMK